MKRLKSVRNVLAALALAVSGACAQSTPAMAEVVQLSPEGCVSLGDIVTVAADFRDAGVDMEKYIAILQKNNPEVDALTARLIIGEIRKVFSTGISAGEALIDVLKRCGNARGRMDLGADI